MKIAFRADASVDLGSGHVMRCLTLADQLREAGARTVFLCRPLEGHLGEQITARGHRCIELPRREGFDQDAADCRDALSHGAPWDWLVVDHYGLDARWERALRPLAKKILVIDDLADRSHDCDLLLDQNLQAPGRYAACVPAGCQCLLGPDYALLRPQFAACRARLTPREGVVREILVSFGGGDAPNAAGQALDALRRLDRPDIAIRIVAGANNPHVATLAEQVRSIPNTHFQLATDQMAELMSHADLGIGAPGSSTWERCAVGLPALLLSIAVNQEAIGAAVHEAGAAQYLGRIDDHDADAICAALQSLLHSPDELAAMSRRAWALVDGRGATRVAGKMMGSRT